MEKQNIENLISACRMAAVRLESGTQEQREFNRSLAEKLRDALAKAAS